MNVTDLMWILCGIGIFVTIFLVVGLIIGASLRLILGLVLNNNYSLLSFTSVWTGWAILILLGLIKWVKE